MAAAAGCWLISMIIINHKNELTLICLFFLQTSYDTDVSMAGVSDRSSIPNVSTVQLSDLLIYSPAP